MKRGNKIVTIITILAVACSMVGCRENKNATKPNNEVNNEVSNETSKDKVSEETSKEDPLETLVCKELGFSLMVNKDLFDIVNVKVSESEKDTNLGLDALVANYSASIEDKSQPLFSIHKFDGTFTAEELEEKNPMMTFLKSQDGVTYTIQYVEEASEELSQEGKDKFADVMNGNVKNFTTTFEIIS